jgi:hypothetical protein
MSVSLFLKNPKSTSLIQTLSKNIFASSSSSWKATTSILFNSLTDTTTSSKNALNISNQQQEPIQGILPYYHHYRNSSKSFFRGELNHQDTIAFPQGIIIAQNDICSHDDDLAVYRQDDENDALSNLSTWFISTLKRRKKKMNKHKLRKRRKLLRLKTKK